MRTALGRVLGLGSSKTGTEDFIKDKLRAVALLILTPYVVGLALWLFGRPLGEIRAALASPLVSIPIGIFIAVSILHMQLGMKTIIEDYVHHGVSKHALLFLNSAFCMVLGAATLFALLKLALGLGTP
ncbi:succinate dehydrogenase, hydrophobic membrane anchor protein [Rhizobium glycinendophyticum]|nr:succinate dehydrogenase, hydrophobic membrane anchor protein [Rhizobium glycinendophyticum]